VREAPAPFLIGGWLFFRSSSGTCLAVAVTAALEQKYLAALCAFPGKHSKLGVYALLHEPVPCNPGQFGFVAIGVSFAYSSTSFGQVLPAVTVGILTYQKPLHQERNPSLLYQSER
jgi:hypothetical protein